MKSRIIIAGSVSVIVFILFLMPVKLTAQAPDSLWMHHYGGSDREIGFDAIEGDPGYYYIVGKTKSYGNGGYDGYILLLDNNGGTVWEKTYGDLMDEQIFTICPALYGGYVMTGYTTTNENSSEIWLLWINDDGDSLWSKTYGGLTSDQGYYIRPNIDQGYTMTARLSVYQWGDQVYLLKLDQAGDTLWTKIYGTPQQDYGVSVLQTGDGGYIIAGRTYASYTAESGDAWAIRTDSNGDTLWTRKYGGSDEDMFYCVAELEDGFLFAGQTRSFGPGFVNVYVVRTDNAGDTIWTRTYGGAVAQNCYTMHEKENGNFVLCGYSSSFSPQNDVYMLEIDPDGNMLWQKKYGVAGGDEYMYGCRPTSDGGYIITGWTNYYFSMSDEAFVLKLGPASSGMPEKIDEKINVSAYPNPFQSSTTLTINAAVSNDCSLEIYNSAGICVESFKPGKPTEGIAKIHWDATALPSGVYFCRLISRDAVGMLKLMKTEK